MKKICFLALVIFIAQFSLAQNNILSYKNFTNMKDITAVGEYSDYYICSTTGGLFLYNKLNESFIQLTKVENLSTHDLTSMTIDSFGKVWMGTMDGIINVYDFQETGEVTKILDIANSDKDQKQINDVYYADNKIFISTNFGLSILDEESMSFDETIVRFGTFDAESKVNSICYSNKIFIALDAGVAIAKDGAQNLSAPESWDSYPVSLFEGAAKVNSICTLNNDVYAATDKGLFIMQNNTWSRLAFEGSEVIKVLPYGNTIYAILESSIYNVNTNERIFINNDITLSDFMITNDSKYLLGSNKGLWIISQNEEPAVIIPEGPLSNSFVGLTIDNEGNLWNGTGQDVYGIGVLKYDGTSWELFNTANTPAFKSNSFHKIHTTSDNTVYMMNWGKGYTIYKDGNFTTYDHSNTSMMGISEDTEFIVVTGVQEDSKGNIWVLSLRSANRNHLNVLTPEGNWYHYSIDSPYLSPSNSAEHLVIDANDTKWFAITNGNRGLYYFNENNTLDNTNDDQSGRLTESNDLRSSAVTSLAIDKRGELWIGTAQGINYIANTNTRLVLQTGVPIRGQNVNCIAVDAINRKWMGTNEGLFIMSSDGHQAIEQLQSSNSPLPSDEIKSIAINENEGLVYVGTDFGLTEMKISSIEPKESFDELVVYPNPFYVGNSYSGVLSIDGLVRNSSIKILTIDGKLITEFSTSGGRLTFWDGRDSDGEFVSSGIYIIVAYDEEVDNVVKGKVAVFNK